MHYIDTLYAKLKQLEATPGKNDKLAIVKTFTPEELGAVILAIDPAYTFYIAKLPEPSPCESFTDEWGGREIALLVDLSTRARTGNTARRAIGHKPVGFVFAQLQDGGLFRGARLVVAARVAVRLEQVDGDDLGLFGGHEKRLLGWEPSWSCSARAVSD